MTSDPPFRRRSRRVLPGEPSNTSERANSPGEPHATRSVAVEPIAVKSIGPKAPVETPITAPPTPPERTADNRGSTNPVAPEDNTTERPKRTILGLGLAPNPEALVGRSIAPKGERPATPDVTLQPANTQRVITQPAQPVTAQPVVTQPVITQPAQRVTAQQATTRPITSEPVAPSEAVVSSQQVIEKPIELHRLTSHPTQNPVTQQSAPEPTTVAHANDRQTSGSGKPLASTEAGRRKSRRVLGSTSDASELGSTTARSERGEHDLEPLPPSKAPKPVGRFPFVTILKWIVLTAALLTLVAGIIAFVAVRRYAADLPSVEDLKAGYNPPQITRIVAREGTLLAAEFTERRTVIPFEQIPNSAKLAFLAAEDASFYEHEGINYLGLARAVFANLRAGKAVQGGSTITQQVVKNVLLDPSRSLRRKVREFLLALRLERSLTKDEIFWLYLNHIYLGHGRYGIEEATRYYFGKRASELGLDEAAVLAGITASPENYSPRRDADKALNRRRFVVGQMLAKGFVTQEVHDQVMAMPLRLAPTTESESRLAPEIVHTAKDVITQALGEQKNTGGYTIHTTIDPELQAVARQALRANLDRYMERHKLVPPYKAKEIKSWGPAFQGKPHRNKVYVGTVEKVDDLAGVLDVRVGDVLGQVALSTETRYNPAGLPPSEFAAPGALLRVSLLEEPTEEAKATLRLELGPQSAMVAIDVRSREVLATVGSYEALAGGLDRVTQMKRQPGSAFKPIVYSYALHSRRFTPATVIPVQSRGHGVPDEGPLSIDVRAAVAHSNNEAAELVLQQSGVENVVDWAKALGIESRLRPDLSLALGSYEVTPLELLGAYVAFASGGTARKPKFVNRIAQGFGADLPLPPIAAESAVLTPEEAYLTTSLLRSVVESGTGRAAAKLQREVAGKTGTTNEAKDAWFVGYSTDIACAVWVGYDDGLPLGKSESGATTALPAWIEFMEAAHKKRPHTRFVRPASILAITVDPATGLLAGPGQANARMEEFLPGTEPTEIAPPPELESSESVPSTAPGEIGQPPQPSAP